MVLMMSLAVSFGPVQAGARLRELSTARLFGSLGLSCGAVLPSGIGSGCRAVKGQYHHRYWQSD